MMKLYGQNGSSGSAGNSHHSNDGPTVEEVD